MKVPDPAKVDWARMAEPRDDGYDAEITLAFATTGGSPLRPEPYVRRVAEGIPLIADTRVALRDLHPRELAPPRFACAPADHPNLPKAFGYLRRWPAAHAQFLRLVDSVHACLDLTVPEDLRDVVTGSCSHSDERGFGTVCVTVDSAIGCAQALVREMAHQKLRAVGVSLESAWRIVANDPGELFPSPVRSGVLWPMTAVLHAQYSLIHVAELDLRMLAGESDPIARDRILQLLLRNLVRVEAGYGTLADGIRTDDAGARFVEAVMAWARRVLDRGYDALDFNGYEMRIGGRT